MHIQIAGVPIPKKRPRFYNQGHGIAAYDAQSREKNQTRKQIKTQMAQEGTKFDRGKALSIKMTFGMPIPKSDSQRARNAKLDGSIPHTQKPDIDNLVKFYLDCANEVAWHDDCQVTHLEADKFYSSEPRTEIWIRSRRKINRTKTPAADPGQMTFFGMWGI